VRSRSLPSVCPAPRDARRRLPSSGALGPHFPTFPGTMRRSEGHTIPRGALRWSLAPRSRAGCCAFGGSLAGARAGRSSPAAPGLLVSRCPSPGMSPGDRWRSPVPAFPLSRQAPRSDPGGVLDARPVASSTAAFRPLETVGFPLQPAAGSPCAPRLYLLRGSITRPAPAFPPASDAHCWAGTGSSLPTCGLGFSRVGREPYRLAPPGSQEPVS